MKSILVVAVLRYLRFCGHLAVKIHRPRVIGIAGSLGKSSTRNAVHAALKDNLSIKVVAENTQTGVPLGLLGIKPSGYSPLHWLWMLLRAPFGLGYLRNTPYVIVEMGIDGPDEPLNMKYLLRIVQPTIAVSLNIAPTHTGLYNDALSAEDKQLPDAQRMEKILEMMAHDDTRIIRESGCSLGIVNADDAHIMKQIQHWAQTEKTDEQNIWTFGEGESNQAFMKSVTHSDIGTTFVIQLADKEVTVTIPQTLLPRMYWQNIAVALLVAQACDVPVENAVKGIEAQYTLPKGRASVLSGINNSTIIDSSYNASRAAIIPFLELLDDVAQKDNRERIALIGDMRELGDNSASEHALLAPEIQKHADVVYCVGEWTQKILVPELQKLGMKNVQWFTSAEKLGQYLKTHLPANAVVLAKGSQNTIFLEEAIKQILANPEDTKKLCRQEPYWLEIKKNYFTTVQ
jgi:UDP-N-acetylmuramoyl-tripeptide--D-alanyl-D-alanine ligase